MPRNRQDCAREYFELRSDHFLDNKVQCDSSQDTDKGRCAAMKTGVLGNDDEHYRSGSQQHHHDSKSNSDSGDEINCTEDGHLRPRMLTVGYTPSLCR